MCLRRIIIWPGVILVIVLIYTAPLNASDTASFTVTAKGATGVIEPPSSFTVTWISDTSIKLDWVQGYGANTTLILAKVGSLSGGPTDGYILYSGNGTSTTDTFADLNIIGGKVNYTAYSFNGTDYSIGVNGDVEGIGVQEVADQLSRLNDIIDMLIQYLPVIMYFIGGVITLVINYFAYRFRERWLYVAGGFALMLFGFGLWNYLWQLSILLVVTGIYNFGKAGFDKGAWGREE